VYIVYIHFISGNALITREGGHRNGTYLLSKLYCNVSYDTEAEQTRPKRIFMFFKNNIMYPSTNKC